MKYRIEEATKRKYDVGDYFLNDNNVLYRIIEHNISDGFTKQYALFNEHKSAIASPFYKEMNNLVNSLRLYDMDKVTQTEHAVFVRGGV